MVLYKCIGGFMISKVQLQQAIKELIKSESDFARKVGVSRQSINKWLNTDQVSYEKLFELIEKAGIEVDLMIRDKEVRIT